MPFPIPHDLILVTLLYVLVSVKEVPPHVLFFHTWLAASELIKMDITPRLKAFNGFPLLLQWWPTSWLALSAACLALPALQLHLAKDTSPGTLLKPCWSSSRAPAPSCPRTFALTVSSAWNAFPSLVSSKLLPFFSLSLVIIPGGSLCWPPWPEQIAFPTSWTYTVWHLLHL